MTKQKKMVKALRELFREAYKKAEPVGDYDALMADWVRRRDEYFLSRPNCHPADVQRDFLEENVPFYRYHYLDERVFGAMVRYYVKSLRLTHLLERQFCASAHLGEAPSGNREEVMRLRKEMFGEGG
jgi:hypothetical protein